MTCGKMRGACGVGGNAGLFSNDEYSTELLLVVMMIHLKNQGAWEF